MDVDDIQPGTDFVEEINRKLKGTHAMIVMIGPQWVSLENQEGQRRLFEPRDFVRIEVEQALKKKLRVFPVLVDNAVMPSEHELPDSIKSLSRLHALSLSSKDFNYQQHQVQQIVSSLATVLDPNNTRDSVVPKPKKKSFLQKTVRFFIWTGVILGGALGLSLLVMKATLDTVDTTNQQSQTYVPSTTTTTTSSARQVVSTGSTASPNTSINLTGTWYDEYGNRHLIVQFGTSFSMVTTSNNTNSQSNGSINGSIVNFAGAQGQLEADQTHMQVANNDGTRLRLHKDHLPQ